MLNKMYVCVRKDLNSIYKMVQGSHALAQFALDYTQIFNKWNNSTIVFVDVNNETELLNLMDKLQRKNVDFSHFIEPDIGNQITSIAFLGNEFTKNITKKYKLANE